jgi:hypothetical protein
MKSSVRGIAALFDRLTNGGFVVVNLRRIDGAIA